MRRISTFSALAIGGIVVAACGGSGDAMEEVASTAGDMTVAGQRCAGLLSRARYDV